MENQKMYILITYGYVDEGGIRFQRSAIVCGSAQFRMPGKRMVDVCFVQGRRPGLGIIGDGVFASYVKCEEPECGEGDATPCNTGPVSSGNHDSVACAYVEYGMAGSESSAAKAIVHDNTILEYALPSGSSGRMIVRRVEGSWSYDDFGESVDLSVVFRDYKKELGFVETPEVVARKTVTARSPSVIAEKDAGDIGVPTFVNVKVVSPDMVEQKRNPAQHNSVAIVERPKKCAFAIYANGGRHERFRNNLVSGLKTFVPGIDIVNLDLNEAKEFLPGLSGRMAILFARLAIPAMRQFKKYDRVIWVDVDTDIQSGMFAGILDVETSDFGLAAAADMYNKSYRAMLRRRVPSYKSKTYFNSGLIVMDLYKINAASWEKNLLKAVAEFRHKKFRKEDQDVLNAFFDISEIDIKYNYIWGRGAEGAKDAWMVHYCARGGHRDLEKILDNRRNTRDSEVRGKVTDRCVVTAIRPSFVRSWIRSYFASGNTLPLVIIPGDPDGFSDKDMAYCKSAVEFCGGMILDCSEEWKKRHALRARAAQKHQIGWYTKKLFLYKVAKDLHPKSWAWLDDDAEVTGVLDECFDCAEKSPGFIYTQFYRPNRKDECHPARYYMSKKDKGAKINWGSFTIFHGKANAMLSEEFCKDFPVEDDESIMAYLYKNNDEWRNGFCDFSQKRWQKSCKRLSQIPKTWNGKVLHYCSNANKHEVKKMWGKKFAKLPPAPFEDEAIIFTMDGHGGVVESKQDAGDMVERGGDADPVDAVFVIGTGSRNNNEELRYALRNLDAHCKFIRNVYICGECPPWVDRSIVKHLPWPDRFRHAKDANIIDKLRHACEQDGISNRILFCSDDQFQTRQCTWDDFYPRYLRQYTPSDGWYAERKRAWHDRLRDTLERDRVRRIESGLNPDNVFYWQPHIWMQIDRDKFVEYAKWSGYEHRKDTIIASGYFNYVDAKPTSHSDHVFMGANTKTLPKVTHIAYADGSYNAAMRFLRLMFPEKCRFELGADYHITTTIRNLSVVKVLDTKNGLMYTKKREADVKGERVDKNKIAIAVYSRGKKHGEYKNNLVRSVKKHIPEVDVVEIDPSVISDITKTVPGKAAAYFAKLSVPLDGRFDKYDRVVYVDADAEVVSRDFLNISSARTSSDGLAAVPDLDQRDRIDNIRKIDVGYNRGVYVCSGMVVFDMKKIDKKSWRRRLEIGIRKWLPGWRKRKTTFHDQIVLNMEFDVEPIDPRFSWFGSQKLPEGGALLIHYPGTSKPRLDFIVASRKVGQHVGHPVDIVYATRCAKGDADDIMLKMSMRSLERHGSGFGRIIVVSERKPSWLSDNAVFVDASKFHMEEDRLPEKSVALNIIKGARAAGVSEDFLFHSDSFLFLNDIDLQEYPWYYGGRVEATPNYRWSPDRMRHWERDYSCMMYLGGHGLKAWRKPCESMYSWMCAKHMDEAETLLLSASKNGAAMSMRMMSNALFDRDGGDKFVKLPEYMNWKARGVKWCMDRDLPGFIGTALTGDAKKDREVIEWASKRFASKSRWEK